MESDPFARNSKLGFVPSSVLTDALACDRSNFGSLGGGLGGSPLNFNVPDRAMALPIVERVRNFPLNQRIVSGRFSLICFEASGGDFPSVNRCGVDVDKSDLLWCFELKHDQQSRFWKPSKEKQGMSASHIIKLMSFDVKV